MLLILLLVWLPTYIEAKSNFGIEVCLSKHDQHARKLELFHRHCLEIELPYKTVTLPEYSLNFNFTSSDEVIDHLRRWQGVKVLPKCWPYLQVALCSVLMPQLDDQLRLHKPSFDICNDLVNRNNCKFIERHHGWPRIFNCSDTNIYARNCTNELRDMRPLATQEVCQYPLVPTSEAGHVFMDVKGCALHCKYPILNQTDQHHIGVFIRILSTIGLISTFVVMILFEIAGTNRSEIDKVFKRCNLCKFISYIGWSLQILSNNSGIACTPDGAPLRGLPLIANTCVLTFFLTYLPSLSYTFWYGYLGKLCHEKLMAKTSNPQSPEPSKLDFIFNLLNFIVPSIMFVIVAFLGKIDGHGLHGICIVGYESIVIKTLFDYGPTLIGALYGNYYFIITISAILSKTETIKPTLRRNLTHMISLTIFTTMQILTSISSYSYVYRNNARWSSQIDSYVACKLNLHQLYDSSALNQDCSSVDTQPMVVLEYLELFSTLVSGIVIASWGFSDLSLKGLRAKLIKALDSSNNDPSRLQDGERAKTNNPFKHSRMALGKLSGSLASIGSSLYESTSIGNISKYRRRSNSKSARDVVNDQRNNILANTFINPLITGLPGILPPPHELMKALFVETTSKTIQINPPINTRTKFDFVICEPHFSKKLNQKSNT